MKNKGFTIIELITTFALATVLIIFLLNTVIVIKNIYSKNEIKSKLMIEQGNLSYIMNKKFDRNFLVSCSPCPDSSFCFEFDFVDGTKSKLDIDNMHIKFDNYSYELIEGTIIGAPSIKKESTIVNTASVNDSFLIIDIPITNSLFPNLNFGINLVYQYNSNEYQYNIGNN